MAHLARMFKIKLAGYQPMPQCPNHHDWNTAREKRVSPESMSSVSLVAGLVMDEASKETLSVLL